jgi:membrane protein YdbS with pleckstrin-like domain
MPRTSIIMLMQNRERSLTIKTTHSKQLKMEHSNKLQKYIEIRQSVLVLIFKILLVELFMTIVHLMIGQLFSSLNILNLQFGVFFVGTWELLIFHIVNSIWLLTITTNWATTVYMIGEKQICITKGVFSKNTQSYDIKGVQEVKVNQNLIDRLFNFGTIHLYNPLLQSTITLSKIPKPEIYAEAIREERDKATDNDKIIPRNNNIKV